MNRAFMIAGCCQSVKKPAITFGLPLLQIHSSSPAPRINDSHRVTNSWSWVSSGLAHTVSSPLRILPRASSTSLSST